MYYSNLSKRRGVEELEEGQALDWISMNSKEADRGKEREREKGWRNLERERGERQSARARWHQRERVEERGKKTYMMW